MSGNDGTMSGNDGTMSGNGQCLLTMLKYRDLYFKIHTLRS